MLGAIIGDVVGSRFEFNNYRGKDFELFHPTSRVTDDSVLTIAIADAIMAAAGGQLPADGGFDEEFFDALPSLTVQSMQTIGRPYDPQAAYGGSFRKWLFSDDPKPYNSYGNGAAMRVSAAAEAASSEEDVKRITKAVTAVSHDHPEGLKGAEATAMAIYMARQGASKEAIKRRIEQDYYPLDFTIDEIRPTYRFNETCQGTVPEAIKCFLESTSFEDAIRTAISLGGDSDTVGAITGSIAEAYYGVPKDLADQVAPYLDERLGNVVERWANLAAASAAGQYGPLTRLIDPLNGVAASGALSGPDPDYPPELYHFMARTHEFMVDNPELGLSDYMGVLRKYGWGSETGWDELATQRLPTIDAALALAALVWITRAERWGWDGAIAQTVNDGQIQRLLQRLKDLDEKSE